MLAWLFFPPISSLALLALVVLSRDREAAYPLPPALLGGLIAAYLCLCALSVFFISRHDQREQKYLGSICGTAQGLMLLVLSLQMGAPFFSWAGLALFLFSMIAAFIHATGGAGTAYDAEENRRGNTADENAAERERIESLLAKLALPICITDTKGVILGATPPFFEAIGREQGEIEGEVIGDILPLDGDEADLESGVWWIGQAKEGSRHYISLLPTKDCKPDGLQTPAARTAGLAIQNLATGLYTDEYRKIRGPEEVARALRYKRWLSGLLIELHFSGEAAAGLPDHQGEMLFGAFAQRVKESLRSIDCGFLTDRKRRVQILLPETPQAGANTLLTRLKLIPKDVFDEDITDAVRPSVKGAVFFFGGTPPMDYNTFSAALDEALAGARNLDAD